MLENLYFTKAKSSLAHCVRPGALITDQCKKNTFPTKNLIPKETLCSYCASEIENA